MHRETDRQRTTTLNRRAVASDDKAQAGRLELSRGKLILGGLGFLLLTVGIFWHQFHQIQAGDERPGWDQLRWGYLLLILLCLPIETVCAALRIWLLCRVLHPGVRLWTCVKAELSNVSVSMLTPSQTGGGPAQIYMLSREGVRVGTSLTISLISFMGTMAVLVLMGLYSLLVSGIGDIAPLFLTAFWIVILIISSMVFAALRPAFLRLMLGTISRVISRIRGRRSSLHDWWPPGDQRRDPPVDRMGRFACRLADIVYIYRDDASRFLGKGKASFAWVCLLSTAFLFSRTLMPYLCLRFLGLETSTLRQIVELQMTLIFLVFFAPTPGSAGLAEGASMAIMSEMVPVGFVPYYNLLWRFSTAYLAALAGFLCLIHAVTRDLRKTVRQSREPEPTMQENNLGIPQSTDQSHERMEIVP